MPWKVITFPLNDTEPTRPAPTVFTNTNWLGTSRCLSPFPEKPPSSLSQWNTLYSWASCFSFWWTLIWKSQKELCTSQSSCKAEVKAMDECTNSVQWLCNLLECVRKSLCMKGKILYFSWTTCLTYWHGVVLSVQEQVSQASHVTWLVPSCHCHQWALLSWTRLWVPLTVGSTVNPSY